MHFIFSQAVITISQNCRQGFFLQHLAPVVKTEFLGRWWEWMQPLQLDTPTICTWYSFWCLPGELNCSIFNEKATARKLPRAINVNAMRAPNWRTKDRKMKGKADEPSSVLALVIRFSLLGRFKASRTAVNLASPPYHWFKSTLEWYISGRRQERFSFVF